MKVIEYGWSAPVTCGTCRSRLEVGYTDVYAVQRRADASEPPQWLFRATCCVCGALLPIPVNHTYIEGSLIQAAMAEAVRKEHHETAA